MKEWSLIDSKFKEKLPKQDCKIWITRTCFTGERWVQKVDYYAESKDIEWDGTIAWMIAEKNDAEPIPCTEKFIITVQEVR